MGKHCIICDSEEWDYDVVDGVFDYCRGCHERVHRKLEKYSKNEDGLYRLSDLLRAAADARDDYKAEVMANTIHNLST